MEEMNKMVEVDGYRYLVQHPQVEEAFDIGIGLMKMIGGSAATMATAHDEQSAAAALNVAVNGLLKNIDPGQSMGMIKRLFKYVECQGKSGGDTKKFLLDDAGVKTHFRGRTGAMIRLMGEVVAFTHTDFFEAVGDGVTNLMEMAQKKMEAAA